MCDRTKYLVFKTFLFFSVLHSSFAARTTFALNELEDLIKTFPTQNNSRDALFDYTKDPHVAGTPGDYETAVYTRDKWNEYGIDATLDEFEVTLSYPVRRNISMSLPGSNEIYYLPLREEYEGDPDNNADIVPTFNGYSPGGNVTGELVFANYGMREDFKHLQDIGISLEGKIVIVKYGRLFRGLKARLASEQGAVGVLIYSDPIDDGYLRGTEFPNGIWRPKFGVQRGSVQFLSICPGDVEGRKQLCGDEPTIPSIPVQPISWGDAEPLLRALNSTLTVPKEWEGGLNVTHYGPGPAIVNMDLEMIFNKTKVWNVIGKIAGKEEPDRSVLIGNHRDAWVHGAIDPSSGSTALMETVRSFGLLKNQTGWEPRRNIFFFSWDAEEYGLVGSTWYGEHYAEILDSNAVAYINVDSGVSGGNFGASGTPSLWTYLRNVTEVVTDPASGLPLNQVWNGNMGRLGSGSDYTVFIHHLGIPSVDFGFGGLSGGVYHSKYDNFYFQSNFGALGPDNWEYFVAVAQVMCVSLLRLSDPVLLHFDFVTYSEQLLAYQAMTLELANSHNIDIDFHELNQSIHNFAEIANSVKEEHDRLTSNVNETSEEIMREFNDRTMKAERHFISEEGLESQKRPWYKNLIVAPGLDLGYGDQVFPGIQQAIILGSQEVAQDETQRLTKLINAAAHSLEDDSSGSSSSPGLSAGDWFMIGFGILAITTILGVVIGTVYYFRSNRVKRRYATLGSDGA